jgi:hypothetical protein
MRFAASAALALAIALPAAASADPRQDLIDGMVKCGAIADNTARLACFDALNPTVQAARTAPAPAPVQPPAPAGAPAVASTAPAAAPPAEERPWYDPVGMFGTSPQRAQTTPQQFGGENLPKPPPAPGAAEPPPEVDSITAGVSDYSFNPYGRFLLVLDNGQIWQQLEGDTDRAHFSRAGKNTVTISRGLFGSYNLSVNDKTGIYKVRRLK